MKHEIVTSWQDGMSFVNNIDGFTNIVDASKEFGWNDRGPSPKKLILIVLVGCTGMDIVSLLQKMRESLSSLELKIEAEMTDEHTKVYSDILIRYVFKASDNLDKAKVEKAVNMSQETYCGVAAMLKKASTLKFEILYE